MGGVWVVFIREDLSLTFSMALQKMLTWFRRCGLKFLALPDGSSEKSFSLALEVPWCKAVSTGHANRNGHMSEQRNPFWFELRLRPKQPGLEPNVLTTTDQGPGFVR